MTYLVRIHADLSQPCSHLKGGEPKLGRILEPALQVVDLELELDVEGVEEVAAEHQAVHRGVHGVDPA